MNFEDGIFGLSADLFADDLCAEGSILDFDLENLKPQSAPVQSLEDLLLQDTKEDGFGEEWMESVDVHSLLDTRTAEQTGVVEVKKAEPEPRKEGMKAAAFELLKALLTTQQPVKADTSLELFQPVKDETTVVLSPVAEVPNVDFSGCEGIEVMPNSAETPQIQVFQDLIEIQPEISLDNGDVVEMEPQYDNSYTSATVGEVSVWSSSEDCYTGDGSSYIASPVSSEDVDSMLSSPISSPSQDCSFSTIDTSFLRERKSSSAKSIQVSSEDFTRIKSKSKKNKSRASPYDSDDSVCDKRQRKKVQNKNAATRYRVKKRQEKESLQEQEVGLLDKNKQLREKVESLQREIKYMKELMNEINKVKKSKV